MRKAVFSLFILVLLLLMAPAAFAKSVGIYVNLHSSSPIISDHDGHYYQECTLTLGASGPHNFSYSNIIGMPTDQPIVLVYPQGGFNPASWETNLISLNLGGPIYLAAGVYTVAFSTNTGALGNGGVLYLGTYTATVTGPGSVTADCSSGQPIAAVANDDIDGDGISNGRDNCPDAYNPDQEDGWGTTAGDACDTDWYNMIGIGIAGFTQKSGIYHLHGNCTFMADGDPRCPEIAVFDPATFTPDQMPLEVTTEFAGTWSVWVYYLHSNGGADVYQVNIYSTNPPQPDSLLDDRLEFHVSGGAWQWYQRGGDKDFGGLPAVNTSASGTSFGG